MNQDKLNFTQQNNAKALKTKPSEIELYNAKYIFNNG